MADTSIAEINIDSSDIVLDSSKPCAELLLPNVGLDEAIERLKQAKAVADDIVAPEGSQEVSDLKSDLPADEVRVDVCEYPSFFETIPIERYDLTMDQAFDFVTNGGTPFETKDKNSGPYFTGPMRVAPWVLKTKEKMDEARAKDPTVPYEGVQRSERHSLGGSIMKWDLDGPSDAEVDAARRKIKASGLAARMFTTHSHGAEEKGNRFRVAMVTDRKASVQEYRRASEFLGGEFFGQSYDPTEHNTYQQAGVWMAHPDRVHLASCEHFEGTAVSLDKSLALAPPINDKMSLSFQSPTMGVDEVTKRCMGQSEPFEISRNQTAVDGALEVMDPDSEDDWRWALKLVKGLHEFAIGTEKERDGVLKKVMSWSQRSALFESEEQQLKKMAEQRAEHPLAFLKHVSEKYGWKNPGPDRPAAALDPDKRIEQLRTLGSDRLVARLGDVIAAMSCPDIAGVRLAYDAFTGPSISEIDEDTWRALNDADAIELRVRLENQCFRSVNGQMARDALTGVMGRNQIDTAQLWAGKLPEWDGVSRVDAFMSSHFGAKSNDYSKSVSRYMFTALAGRLLEPGCKADMVPILVGPQGGRKSTGVMSLCPSSDAFAELNFHKADDDAKRLLRGRLIVEIAELAGMGKKDSETLKQFLSARFDMWRPTYHEGMARYERRCIFIGTSNRDDFLKDPTGHRRFLPIKVGKVDVKAILRDRDQLWAEGIHLFKKHGVLFTDAEELAKDEHEEFEQSNPLAERIERVLKQPSPMEMPCMWDSTYLKLDDVMALLDIPPRDMARMQPEVCNALKALGYEKAKRRWEIGEKPVWRWVRQVEEA